MNQAWQQGYNQKVKDNVRNYVTDFPEYELGVGRIAGSNSTRPIISHGMLIEDVDPSNMPSNGCYKIHNQPNGTQVLNYSGPKHTSDVFLRYNCFIPAGETYEFLPCEPYNGAEDTLGFKEVRGVDTIMQRTGAYNLETKAFAPYKLLLYRGRLNDQPELDDKHRFVYLAQNKPTELVVGDCFIRLEEVHNRMRGDVVPYVEDCDLALNYATQMSIIEEGNPLTQPDAIRKVKLLQQQHGGILRFRCWTVEGQPSYWHEEMLCKKLFYNVNGKKPVDDHVEEFRVWAELLRKSQGDKLASKEFFGRYWDAVIPNTSISLFHDGMKIVVSATYLNYLGFNENNPPSLYNRATIKKDVYEAVRRVINAPRLKFKPDLPERSIIFPDEVHDLPCGWQSLPPDTAKGYRDLSNTGWRTLEAHPGGLYSILINRSVREFFLNLTLYKPLWQSGYPVPGKEKAEGLHDLLDKCGKTSETITAVVNDNVVAASKNPKRNPTQDRCVANAGFSANVALSVVYPDIYPNSAMAKKRRVAEWLHRSAFSYGGLMSGGILSTPQVANNLVLGSPETNTLMMRYESFIKRVALFGNHGQGDAVRVVTNITYPNLVGWNQGWVGDDDHKYTWLAPEILYSYKNDVSSDPHVSQDRPIYPMNRETAMLFESLLDKSLEAMCWKWSCWDVNKAVAEALVESTGVDGDQEEVNQEDLKEMLDEELNERDQQV